MGRSYTATNAKLLFMTIREAQNPSVSPDPKVLKRQSSTNGVHDPTSRQNQGSHQFSRIPFPKSEQGRNLASTPVRNRVNSDKDLSQRDRDLSGPQESGVISTTDTHNGALMGALTDDGKEPDDSQKNVSLFNNENLDIGQI